MENKKIFISHASKDVKIVEAFVKHILRLGLNISADRIFCTSMEGHGVRSGEYIPDRLKVEINKSCIAFLLISKNYKKSEVCLNEVGAAWVSLEKINVIPILLPDVDFDDLGFLDLNRLGLKIFKKRDLIKLIQDNKEALNISFNLELVHQQVEEFLNKIPSGISIESKKEGESEKVSERNECFQKHLIPFDNIIRKAIPTHNDGIHQIEDSWTQTKILKDLSKSDFLRTLWYKQAEGDFYVERLRQLPSRNWLVSKFNWEINISAMWVCKSTEMQYEFILIHSKALPPIKINSDVGGEDYNVGVLTDGTVVSENERLNGYAIINGETIDVYEHGVESRIRDEESHWIFFVSDYHKAGFNPDETIDFCAKLDKGEIEVNSKNIKKFLRQLRNHPTIIRWR